MSNLPNILLITLPQWNPTHPMLSIPMLAGFLKKRGVAVTIRDYNIEFFDWLLNREMLVNLFNEQKLNFDILENRLSLEKC